MRKLLTAISVLVAFALQAQGQVSVYKAPAFPMGSAAEGYVPVSWRIGNIVYLYHLRLDSILAAGSSGGSGTVTSVSGSVPVRVATGTTTPAITVDTGFGGVSRLTTIWDRTKGLDSVGVALALKVNISDTSANNNAEIRTISLTTPSVVYSTPINFSVSGHAASGALTLNTQTANTHFAGPVSGGAAAPTFRALVAGDIPDLSGTYLPLAGGTVSGALTISSANFTVDRRNDNSPTISKTVSKFAQESQFAWASWNGSALQDEWAMYRPASTRDLRFYGYQGGDIFTLQNSTGNIGINQTNPSYKLDVNGTARIVTSLITPILYGSSSSGGSGTLSSTSNATKGKLYFGTANTSAYDEANDRWGIGTSSPLYTLDVTGNVRLTGGINIGNATGAASGILSSSNTGDIGWQINSSDNNSPYLLFQKSSSNKWAIGVERNSGGGWNALSNEFIFYDYSTGTTAMVLKQGGSVGIGQTSPATTSILDIVSTTKGILIPRMTTTQRDAISSPAEGLIIYNTTTHKLNVFTTAWEAVTSL